MPRVRFAPSPTGALHIGGARTALFNYVFVKKHGGEFILRLDDTDLERSKAEYEKGIYEGLSWLGMDWDEGPNKGGPHEPYRQKDRVERHIECARELEKNDKAYVDDGGAMRLRYPKSEIIVEDIVCGTCVFQVDALGPEPVILRSNGTPTYHLASVVDDVDMQITHIIRGADHLTNTAKHQVLFESLGAPVPAFAHLPLILGPDGAKLSKRSSDMLTSVEEFQSAGYLPEAINNFLMLLGWSHPDSKEQLSLEESIAAFELERVGKTGAVFDTNKLIFLNGWWMRHLEVGDVANRLLGYTGEWREQIESRGTSFWESTVEEFRDGLVMLTDAEELARLLLADGLGIAEDLQTSLENDSEFKTAAATLAPVWSEILTELELPGDTDTVPEAEVSQLTSAAKKRSGLKGKMLFKPLRGAVTGSLSGPDLKGLLSRIRLSVLRERAQAFQNACN